jgi:hypothetical protein
MFKLRSNSYFEHGTFESFTCYKVHPTQINDDGAGSSTLGDDSGPSTPVTTNATWKLLMHDMLN